jgi:tetratricopeptide (TPR) repeat protein
MLNTLSGRFLVLTVIFVMLAEVFIFVPSVARFREDYLLSRLERAQIASLALLADDMISSDLEEELLRNAEVFNVVLRRDEARQLMLSSPMPRPVEQTFDLREAGPWILIRDAVACLFDPEPRVVRVIGYPVREGGSLIEVTMEALPLRSAMIDYGLRILMLAGVISVVTAGLLFIAVSRLLVMPIHRVTSAMISYAENPEDPRRIITPSSGITELREAEETLAPLLGPAQSLAYTLAEAEIALERGDPDRAVARLEQELRDAPDNLPLVSAHARALSRSGRHPEAQKALERLANRRPNDARVWYELAETAGQAGDIVAVHRARAEYFQLHGNLQNALQHLNYALQLVENNYPLTARLNQRVQDIREMRQRRAS